MSIEYSTFGRHVTVDLWGVDFNLLNDKMYLEEVLVESANKSGATVLSVQAQKFEPQGVTVLVLLSESHVSIHTYPEKGFASTDAYTCGTTVDPQVIMDNIIKQLKPQKANDLKLKRGDESGIAVF